MPTFKLNMAKALEAIPAGLHAAAKEPIKILKIRTRPVGAPGETPARRDHMVDEQGACVIHTDDPREIRHLRVDPRFDEVGGPPAPPAPSPPPRGGPPPGARKQVFQ